MEFHYIRNFILLIVLTVVSGCGNFRDYYDDALYYRKHGVDLPKDFKVRLSGNTITFTKKEKVKKEYKFDYKTQGVMAIYTFTF